MIVGLVLFVLAIILMIIFIIKKYKIFKVIPLYIIPLIIVAILFIILRYVTLDNLKESFLTSSSINPLKILILFISMSYLSIFLDELGFFKYVASKSVEKSKGSQLKIFISLYFTISLLTVFTSNDIVILTFTPFICYFSKRSKVNPLPYLIMEFTAANTWSMMLLIGNPTNIYLGSYAGIKFFEYIKVMAIPTILSSLVSLLVLILLFKKELKGELEKSSSIEKIENIPLFILGISVLGICIILLSISSYINLDMSLISLICFAFLLASSVILNVIKKINFKYIINSIKRVPYEVIPFLISMFIIVKGLDNIGLTISISSFLNNINNVYSYGVASTLMCNIINNIPMSVLMGEIANTSSNYYASVYSCIMGSNLGALLTPIGALAGILFTSLSEKNNIHISYFKFAKYGSIVLFFTLFTGLISLNIVLNLI